MALFFYREWKQRARHAMQADGQAGVSGKSCAIGVDGHGDDLPRAGPGGDGRRGGMKRREAKQRRASAGQVLKRIDLERERNGFVASAAEQKRWINGLRLERIGELHPLDPRRPIELIVGRIVVVVGNATGGHACQYQDAQQYKSAGQPAHILAPPELRRRWATGLEMLHLYSPGKVSRGLNSADEIARMRRRIH